MASTSSIPYLPLLYKLPTRAAYEAYKKAGNNDSSTIDLCQKLRTAHNTYKNRHYKAEDNNEIVWTAFRRHHYPNLYAVQSKDVTPVSIQVASTATPVPPHTMALPTRQPMPSSSASSCSAVIRTSGSLLASSSTELVAFLERCAPAKSAVTTLPLPLLMPWHSREHGLMTASIILWAVVGEKCSTQPDKQDPATQEFFAADGSRLLFLMTVVGVTPKHTRYDTLCGRWFSSVNALTKAAGVNGSGWDVCVSIRQSQKSSRQFERVSLRDLVASPLGFHNHHLMQDRILLDRTETRAPRDMLVTDMMALLCDTECDVNDCNQRVCRHDVVRGGDAALDGDESMSKEDIQRTLLRECAHAQRSRGKKRPVMYERRIQFASAEGEKGVESSTNRMCAARGGLFRQHYEGLKTQSYWFKDLWPRLTRICENLPWWPEMFKWDFVHHFPRNHVTTVEELEQLGKTFRCFRLLGISEHNPTRYIDRNDDESELDAFDKTLWLVTFRLQDPKIDRVIQTPSRIKHPHCSDAPGRCTHVKPMAMHKEVDTLIYPDDYTHVPFVSSLTGIQYSMEIYMTDFVSIVLEGWLLRRLTSDPKITDSRCTKYSKHCYEQRMQQIVETQKAYDSLPDVELDEMNKEQFDAKNDALAVLLRKRQWIEPAEGWIGQLFIARRRPFFWGQYLQSFEFGVNNPHLHEREAQKVNGTLLARRRAEVREAERKARLAQNSDSDCETDIDVEDKVQEHEYAAPAGWAEMKYMERREWMLTSFPEVREQSEARLRARVQRVKDRIWDIIAHHKRELEDAHTFNISVKAEERTVEARRCDHFDNRVYDKHINPASVNKEISVRKQERNTMRLREKSDLDKLLNRLDRYCHRNFFGPTPAFVKTIFDPTSTTDRKVRLDHNRYRVVADYAQQYIAEWYKRKEEGQKSLSFEAWEEMVQAEIAAGNKALRENPEEQNVIAREEVQAMWQREKLQDEAEAKANKTRKEKRRARNGQARESLGEPARKKRAKTVGKTVDGDDEEDEQEGELDEEMHVIERVWVEDEDDDEPVIID